MVVQTLPKHLQIVYIHVRTPYVAEPCTLYCLHNHTTQGLLLQIYLASLCCLTLPLQIHFRNVAMPGYQCAIRCACSAAHAHQQRNRRACPNSEECDASLVSVAQAQGLCSETA